MQFEASYKTRPSVKTIKFSPRRERAVAAGPGAPREAGQREGGGKEVSFILTLRYVPLGLVFAWVWVRNRITLGSICVYFIFSRVSNFFWKKKYIF